MGEKLCSQNIPGQQSGRESQRACELRSPIPEQQAIPTENPVGRRRSVKDAAGSSLAIF